MESISQPISAAPYPASNWCHFTPLFVSLGMHKLSQYIYPSLFIKSACIKSSLMHMIEIPALLFFLTPGSLYNFFFLHVHSHDRFIYGYVLFIKGGPARFRTEASEVQISGLVNMRERCVPSATRAVDFKTAPKLLELYCDKAALAHCHTLVLINSCPVTLL